MDEFEKELKEDFLSEALEMLDEFEQIFLSLENNQSADVIDQIFRFAHNLKGTSRAVGFGEIAEFTHEMENLILAIKKSEIKINDEIIQTLLECNDHVQIMVNGLNSDLNKKFQSAEIILKIKSHLIGREKSTVHLSVVRPKIETEVILNSEQQFSQDELDKALAGMNPTQGSIDDENLSEAQGFSDEDLMKALKAMAPDLNEQPRVDIPATQEKFNEEDLQNALEAMTPNYDVDLIVTNKNESRPLIKKNKELGVKKKKEELLRVSLSKIEKLNEFVGELVILQSVFQEQQLTGENSESSSKKNTVSQLGKISRELQDIAMSLRMIPIRSTLQKMNRIVRDTARSLDKKVSLTISGESTEVDKSILELIVDPLVHIVRNAVDHGVESPAKRESVGKHKAGNIQLKAFHKGNNLLIEVLDDGKGINTVQLKEKAILKGIINKDSETSDEEIMNLIFHPGFSTKEKVSEVSGRGVGMDVVKTNIQKLGGSVRVFSKLGEGSRFEIILPLTMAIIEGVVVTAGQDRFVLPLNQIQEFIKPEKNMFSHISNIGDCLSIRGETLPVFDLSSKLSQSKEEINNDDCLLVITSNHEQSFAIKIKEILNQQQTVVKKIGSDIKDQQGLIGASILGDGQPAFIVDVENLFVDELSLIPDLNKKRKLA